MSQVIVFKLSDHAKAVESRMRRLPKLTENALDAQTKKDVINVIKEYRLGIVRNNFGLPKLHPATVKNKADAGMAKPRTPLYGVGEGNKNSLINALAYRKIKNGWRLYVRRARHHSSGLPLNVLLGIMEDGAIIKVTPRMRAFLHYIGIHLKKDTLMIRIPPRPIVNKAINRMLRKKKKDEPNKSIRKAINKMIKTGDDRDLKNLADVKEDKNEGVD
jgi:hypothetical protein